MAGGANNQRRVNGSVQLSNFTLLKHYIYIHIGRIIFKRPLLVWSYHERTQKVQKPNTGWMKMYQQLCLKRYPSYANHFPLEVETKNKRDIVFLC